MYLELKENIPHGTKAYPYTQYHIHKMNTSFQVPVHWHDELEIIYILKGVLKVSINGEEFCYEHYKNAIDYYLDD